MKATPVVRSARRPVRQRRGGAGGEAGDEAGGGGQAGKVAPRPAA